MRKTKKELREENKRLYSLLERKIAEIEILERQLEEEKKTHKCTILCEGCEYAILAGYSFDKSVTEPEYRCSLDRTCKDYKQKMNEERVAEC